MTQPGHDRPDARDRGAPTQRVHRVRPATLLARLASLSGNLARCKLRRVVRIELVAAARRLLPGVEFRLSGPREARRPALVPRGSERPPFALAVEAPAHLPLSRAERLALALLVDAAGTVHERLRADARVALLRDEAERDFLTGIFNRRLALRLLERELRKARRRRSPLALALVDVDNFKSFNDRHGHVAGDDVLRRLASVLAATARASDIVGRFGGEEFLVALPDTVIEDGVLFAERLRQAVESYGRRELARYGDRPPTVSIGVCAVGIDDTIESALKRADQALYESKSRGRNCFSLGLPKGVLP
jgi:diguanylate cyclase (GGDEF)-like protein